MQTFYHLKEMGLRKKLCILSNLNKHATGKCILNLFGWLKIISLDFERLKLNGGKMEPGKSSWHTYIDIPMLNCACSKNYINELTDPWMNER